MKFASAIHLTILIPLLGIQFASVLCQNITSGESAEPDTKKLFHLPGLDRFQKVRVNERNFGLVRNMHANWYAAGVKALMAKLGRDLYLQLDNGERQTLAACLDRIEETKDLTESAKCLSNARKSYLRRISMEVATEMMDTVRIGAFMLDQTTKPRASRLAIRIRQKNINEEVEDRGQPSKSSFLSAFTLPKNVLGGHGIKDSNQKAKRSLHNQPKLLAPHEKQSWAQRLRKFKNNGKPSTVDVNKKIAKRRKSKWQLMSGLEAVKPNFQIRQADRLEKLANRDERSTISRVTNLVSKLVGKADETAADNGGPQQSWTRMYQSLVRLKQLNDQRVQSPGGQVYEARMHDLVLDRKEPTLSPRQKKTPKGLVQMGLSLLNKLQSGPAMPNSFKLMSPRFAPLMPDKIADTGNQSTLSPTILALYELDDADGAGRGEERQQGNGQGNNNNGTIPNWSSLPETLKASGMDKRDREALLQLLMELSGSLGHVQMAMDLLKSLNFLDIEPELTETSDRILGAYTKMERSFEPEQEREIERQGWTSLRGPQFEQLCRDQHADFPDDIRAAVDHFGKLRGKDREQALWKRVERIARDLPDQIADKMDSRKHQKLMRLHLQSSQRRRRRQHPNNGLFVLEPITLAPFMFTPVFGLSVLGPLVLSPNMFAPLILAPSVLGPYILSPAAPIPFILSPYVLGPFILSPMALAPFVLSPYVLSPNILNPYALAPLILSPTVLSPDILSPQTGGGAILSPVVGSPAILTNTSLMVSVLSPSVLS